MIPERNRIACTCKSSYERFGKSFAYADRERARMVEVSERNIIRPGGQQVLDRSRENGRVAIVHRNRRGPAAAGQRKFQLLQIQAAQQGQRVLDGLQIVRRRAAAASDINRPNEPSGNSSDRGLVSSAINTSSTAMGCKVVK